MCTPHASMPRSDSAVCSFLWPLQATQTLAVFPMPWFPLCTAVPNSSVPFTSMQYIALCGALYSTWVELSQTACCNFTLTGNDFFSNCLSFSFFYQVFGDWRFLNQRPIATLMCHGSKSMPLSTLVDLMGCEDCNGVNFMPRSLSASRANTHVYALKSVPCRQISTGNWKHTMPLSCSSVGWRWISHFFHEKLPIVVKWWQRGMATSSVTLVLVCESKT